MSENITKTELTSQIAEDTGLTKAQAVAFFDSFKDKLTDLLVEGNSFTISGVGTFSVTERPERKGRNPQTGESITIPKRNALTFKVSSKIKEKLN